MRSFAPRAKPRRSSSATYFSAGGGGGVFLAVTD
jgi:hypothetical protein